ncbi:hypothetical protein ASPSYDRAFT_140826 [Aspergillus sydowii CBS 593.65]|uniref:Uncharacterized protein n=1 Tax=Aspergillus sydowii CBS 593.65 TaxID=1036612 RepID=A0A1L9U0X5_9EURO|nr:uncharacterized protein ASPSYDRAFT_140826 [Aspergillus sydowii CBS 593.65]OJJ65315.1 hypothetical protein ASPSYDRAFT_140826 [Aspergillus sydowii CBS 593.65]
MITQPEAISALLGAIVALNIHILISNLTSVPETVDRLFLGPIYVFSLQVLVAFFLARALCVILNRPFRIQSRNVKALVFLYAVFPVPVMVSWVNKKLLPMVCGC